MTRKSSDEPQEDVKIERPKGDIRKLLEAVPPASVLKAREKRLKEKRVRLRYDPSLDPEKVKLSQELAKELNIMDMVEVVVASRHRFVFHAIIDDGVEYNVVYVNPELMEEHGIADNSIATVRSYKGEEKAGVRLSV